MIGGRIDLDLLSIFPQEQARIIGGIESWASSRRSTMGGKTSSKDKITIWEEDPFYSGGTNPTVMLYRSCTSGTTALESGTTA